MSRFNQFIVLLVAIELLAGGFFLYQKRTQAIAPVPGFSVVDSLTAADLQQLATNCKSPEQWQQLANIYMSAGFFAESDVCFQQALKLKPDWSDVFYQHAFCLSRFGKTKQANEEFEQAIKLKHPQSADAAYFIGQNYLRDENPQLAEAAFRRATILPIAKYELARLLFRKNQLDEAEQLLVEVLTLEPKASQAELLMAEIAVAKNNTTRAISFSSEGSERSIRIPSPFSTEKDRLMQSVVLYGVEKEITKYMNLFYDKKYEEAKIGLQHLQSIEWTSNVQNTLLQIAIEARAFQLAEKLIEEEISYSGPTTLWLGNLGNVRMQMGNPAGAVMAWQQGIQVRNDVTVDKCCSGLGRYYESIGNKVEADHYQVLALIGLAQQAIESDQIPQAIEFLTRALELEPGSAKAHYLLGKAHRLEFANEAAAAAYKNCLAIEPTNGRAIRELSFVE